MHTGRARFALWRRSPFGGGAFAFGSGAEEPGGASLLRGPFCGVLNRLALASLDRILGGGARCGSGQQSDQFVEREPFGKFNSGLAEDPPHELIDPAGAVCALRFGDNVEALPLRIGDPNGVVRGLRLVGHAITVRRARSGYQSRLPGLRCITPQATVYYTSRQRRENEMPKHPTDAEIAQNEADSIRIDNGVQKIKAGIQDIKVGLFGSKKK